MSASTVSPVRAEPVLPLPFPQAVRRWIRAAAIVLVLFFVAHAAQRLLVFTEASCRNLWPNRLWLLPHFIGGASALLAGIAQF